MGQVARQADGDSLDAVRRAMACVADRVLGKEHEIALAFTCLLAAGHLLIEDIPGVGKTTLARSLAQVLGLHFSRVQCTSDLLPSDMLGVNVYLRDQERFVFHPGAIFSQVVLVDEINRASPRTQSALLEAMEERQVTMDGVSHALPKPFFVIATQNPLEQLGTYPLPESQLDRFLMRMHLGYPDRRVERQLLERPVSERDAGQMPSDALSAVLDERRVVGIQAAIGAVHVASPMVDYVLELVAATRETGAFRLGLSPRAGLALLHCARAWAWLAGRAHVLPEDVQAVFEPVAAHRLVATGSQAMSIAELLRSVPVR
jgi:MoxR-like ATPase